ncbi:hypothetical protein RQP46_008556 [Phenoliferia psychrophenolica]
MPITRLSHSPSYTTFREFLLSNEPVLLSPAVVEDWPACQLWFDRDSDLGTSLDFAYLRNQYGSERVTAVDCKTWESEETSFERVLEQWEAGEAASVYVKDWHLPLKIHEAGRDVAKELYRVPEVCLDDWMNGYYCKETTDDFRFVYLGGTSTFTPVHRDVYCSYSISTNIHGRKRWTLFPPACSPKLGLLLKTAERTDSVLDVREWDEETWLEFVEMGAEAVIQEVGETIFIPSGWYHQVENLGLTFSLNHNWANSHNISLLYTSMTLEVTLVRESISDVKELLMRTKGDKWEVEWEECVAELLRQSAGWK